MLGSSSRKLRRFQAAYPIGYAAVLPSVAVVVLTELTSHSLVHSRNGDNFIMVYGSFGAGLLPSRTQVDFGSSKLGVSKLGCTGPSAVPVSSPISARALLVLLIKKIIDNSSRRAVTAHQGICLSRKWVSAGLPETQR